MGRSSAATGRLEDLIEVQRAGCLDNGSALYGDVLEAVADDVRRGGVSARILGPWVDRPFADAVVLRFLAAAHRLVLDGRVPDLAACYPSVGGVPTHDVGRRFLRVVEDHEVEIAAAMPLGVQTNEPGRSASMLGGFLQAAADTGVDRLRVLEIGASAGLNLRFDAYRYECEDGALGPASFGPATSRLRFVDPWLGGRPDLDRPLEVRIRRGCDVAPIDPTTLDGQQRLRSLVWPDQLARLHRLDAALAVAHDVPASVDHAPAARWLEAELADETPGLLTVVFHSIVLQYLDTDERAAAMAAIDDAGERATPDAPLAWLRMEPGGHHAEIRLTTWPGGTSRLLATSRFHGPPIHWLAPQGGSGASPL